MKDYIKTKLLKILNLKLNVKELKQLLVWQDIYNFEEPFPNFVKQKLFESHNSKDTIWVETGTFKGETTQFLAKISKYVYTIEPSEKYFKYANTVLADFSNVNIIYGSSEDCLEETLIEIENSSVVNFWLDGHWSGGETFRGELDTPIELELKIISKYIDKFQKVTVLVDDIRLFEKKNQLIDGTYPDKSVLIEWAIQNRLNWKISKDIFIAF